MSWTRIIECDRCPTGRGVFVIRQGRELAVYRFDDPPRCYVLDNHCPHAGGNLAGGEVADGTVACPWHHWKFDLETGVCTHSALARVPVYATRVEDGVIFADLSSPSPAESSRGGAP
ncbi:MAG: hypothetical protein BroJett003_00350 [Planctomycetota bacterium]|nr:MAG: hypothetical protein BroJett003_00350 [Planctomycetota bacterium]